MLSKSLQALCSQPLLNQVCPDHFRYGQDLMTKFNEHMTDFGLSYGTNTERDFRLQIFAENDQKIQQINSEQSSFQVGHNQFSTYTERELKKMLTGSPEHSNIQTSVAHDTVGTLPDSFDWRKHGMVPPVHNTGQQTILYAEFDAISSAFKIQEGALIELSLKQLIDCAGDMRTYGTVYKYAQDYGFESTDDYTLSQGLSECHFEAEKVWAKIKNIENVNGTVEAIKQAVVKQPVSVAVEADQFTFQAYVGGILDSDQCGTNLDHELLVIGYGKYDGGEYFILKNSWGASWGDHGYIKIKASEGKGVCGMNMQVVRPELETSDCYKWNNQMWLGNAPKHPAPTICGLESCVKCPSKKANKSSVKDNTQTACFEWNKQKWVGAAPEHPVHTICGLHLCVKCPRNNLE